MPDEAGTASSFEREPCSSACSSPATRGLVTPAIEAQLDERQKRVLAHALEAGSVTRHWCVAEFEIANDTAGRDLKSLVDLSLLTPKGQGRGVRYVVPIPSESTGKRPR